jgi:hypothetical protein
MFILQLDFVVPNWVPALYRKKVPGGIEAECSAVVVRFMLL